MSQATTTVEVRLVVVDPPFEESHGVLCGPQRGNVVEKFAPAFATTCFDVQFELVRASDTYDFRGPFVHGKRGDRFLYLSWGVPDASGPFVMFARAKLKLADVADTLLAAAVDGGATLRCELAATNRRGEPASGTTRPPHVDWSTEN